MSKEAWIVALAVIVGSIIIAAVAMFPAQTVATTGAANRLDGTWVNDLMVVTMDFESMTYTGTALGDVRASKMTVLDESDEIVRLHLVSVRGEGVIVCQILPDGRIILRKEAEDAIPLLFKRK